MNKNFLFILLSFFYIGCTHNSSTQNNLENLECEKIESKIPKTEIDGKIERKGKQIAGNIASYTVSGLGYTTDTVIIIGGTVITTVAVCLPLKIAGQMMKVQGPIDELCMRITGKIMTSYISDYESLGKKAYTATETWRCPDFTPVAKIIRQSSECYIKRNKENDLNKAATQMKALTDNLLFMSCLQEDEKEKIKKLTSELNI